jgi:hypothetical protein
MLDSLVRVSRRVGWITDLLALDSTRPDRYEHHLGVLIPPASQENLGIHDRTSVHLDTRTPVRFCANPPERGTLAPVCTLRASAEAKTVTLVNGTRPSLATCSGPSLTAARVIKPVRASARENRKCTTRHECYSDRPLPLKRARYRTDHYPHSEVESSSRLAFVVPPVYLQAVSRPFELSLQSSLQLSLTVLVCYRSHGSI